MHYLLAANRSSVSDFPLALGKVQRFPPCAARALTVSKSAATRWQSTDGMMYEESGRRGREGGDGGREKRESCE